MDTNSIDAKNLVINAKDLILYSTHIDAKKWIAYEIPQRMQKK